MRQLKNAFCFFKTNKDRTLLPVSFSLYVPVMLMALLCLASGVSGQWVTGEYQKKKITYILNQNVGIGTGIPGAPLIVQGPGSSGTIRVWPSNPDEESSIGLYTSPNNSGEPWMISQGAWGNKGNLIFGFKRPLMKITQNGNVFIYGSGQNPVNAKPEFLSKYAMFVEQGVMSEDFAIAPVANWADYVFNKDYKLKNLEDVEAYIIQHKHLEGIPSQKEVEENGYSVNGLNVHLVEKVEELTLYIIKEDNEIKQLKKEVSGYHSLQQELEILKGQIKKLQSGKPSHKK